MGYHYGMTSMTTREGTAPPTDNGGGAARLPLLRMREFMRGHGVASAAEIKAELGLKAARALARQTDRGEFVLLARGVSGLPGTTTSSPEWYAFLERRRAAAASGAGRRADQLAAWAAARDAFTTTDAVSEFGVNAHGMLTDAVRRGTIARTGRGRYQTRAPDVRIVRARHKVPAGDLETVRTLARRTGVFALGEMDLPSGDRRTAAIASLLARREIVSLGKSLYALPHLDASSPQAITCRERVGPSPADRFEDWARTAGVFSVSEAVDALGATARRMVERRMEKGTIARVSRGRYQWATHEPHSR